MNIRMNFFPFRDADVDICGATNVLVMFGVY